MTNPILSAVLSTCEDKKAENIATYDLKSPQFTDFAVVCCAQNTIQIKAIASELQLAIKDKRIPASDILSSGNANSGWVILEIPGIVCIHITLQSIRDYYDLDGVYSRRMGKA